LIPTAITLLSAPLNYATNASPEPDHRLIRILFELKNSHLILLRKDNRLDGH